MARTRSAAAAAAFEASAPSAASSYPAWARPVKDVLEHFEVTLARGLTAAQVAAQRVRFGFNELEKEQGKPLWKLVLEQFDDPLVKVRARPASRSGERPSLPPALPPAPPQPPHCRRPCLAVPSAC